ncbi:uro-adherence factor A-like isoform X1 [Littorina saxatilis]|uniref:uro-adherence factor A-like isoform X1 n=1 Tax=Littorina saxatilis TaxID=31220 RepID=UPI0038B4665D
MSQTDMDGSCDADSIVIDCSDDEYSPLDTDTPQSPIEVANRETVDYLYHDGQVDNSTENRLACDRETVCQLPFVSSVAQSETSQVEPTTCQSPDTGSTSEAHTERAGFTVSQSVANQSASSMDSAATRYATALLREEPSVNTAESCASESLGFAAMPSLPTEQAQTGSLSEPRIVDVRSLREESGDLTEWGATHRAVHDEEELSDADQFSTSNQLDMQTDNIGQSDGFASHLLRVTPPIGEDVVSEHDIRTVLVSTEEGHCLQTQAAIIKSEQSVSGSDQRAPDFREGSWFWLEMAGRQHDTTASQDTDNHEMTSTDSSEQFPYFRNSHDCEESPIESCQDMLHSAGSRQHEAQSEECAQDIRHGIPNFLDVPFAADTEGVTSRDSQSHGNVALENQLHERTMSGRQRNISDSSESQQHERIVSESHPTESPNAESHSHDMNSSESQPNESTNAESHQSETNTTESCPHENNSNISDSCPSERAVVESPLLQTTAPESQSLQTTAPESQSLQTTAPKSQSLQRTAPESQSLQTTAPESQSLQTTAPESQSLQTTAPESQSLQTTAPESQSLQRTAPESQSLQRTAPGRHPRQTSAPERHPRQTTAPESQPLQTTAPKRHLRQTTAPERHPRQTTAPESQPLQTTSPERHPRQATAPERHPRQTTAPERHPRQTTAPERHPRQATAPEKHPRQATAPERYPRQTTAPERHPRQTTAPENQSLQTTASASQSNRRAATDDSLQEVSTSNTAWLSSRQRKRTHRQMCHSGRTSGEEVALTEETSVDSADVLLNPDISEPSSSTASALGDESSALPHTTPPRKTPGHAAKASTRILRSRRKLASSSKQATGRGLKQNHSDQAAGEGSGDDHWWGTTAELPGDIVNVPGDGHCLIHAAVHASCEAGNQITHDELCNELMCEILCFRDHYENFTTDGQDIIRELSMFIFDNHYDTDTCDLLLGALPNVLESNVDVYHFQDNDRKYQRIKFRPQRQSVQPQRTILLISRGHHYSALVPFRNNTRIDKSSNC